MALTADQILDHPLIAQRYFFPRPCRFPSPLVVNVENATLACSFHFAAPDAPTVVHFHGNGEVVCDYLDGFAKWFAWLGWNLFLAEYRGYGMSTGEPLLGQMLDDVVAVVQATRTPLERLVVFGRSVGSIFALEATARFPSLAGVILESGVADPLERLLLRVHPGELGVTSEAFAAAFSGRLDHKKKLANYGGPLLLMHSVHDSLVPLDNAERLASWARGPVTNVQFQHGGHNSVLHENRGEYLDAVSQFLSNVLP